MLRNASQSLIALSSFAFSFLLTFTPLAAQSQTGTLAVVPNLLSGDVSIISSASNTEVARIPVGPYPMLATASADGRYAYVASDRQSWNGTSTIWKIDFQQLLVVDSLSLQLGDAFFALVVSPDGQLLAAVDSHQSTVYLIDTATMLVDRSVALCTVCDGAAAPLNAPARVSFTPDSLLLTGVVPVVASALTIDTQTGQIISSSSTGSVPGSSVPFTDLARYAPLGQFLLSAHPYYGVRLYDVLSSFSIPLPFFDGSYTFDIELAEFAGLLLGFAGSIEYDPSPDFLHVFSFFHWAGLHLPASESLRWLRYNSLTSELWGTCISWVFGGYCSPFLIDTFSLNAGFTRATLAGPTGLLTGLPSFSNDEHYYYQPLPTNELFVVDAVTKQPLPRIPVGTSPQVVVFQGDLSEKEPTS